METEIIADSGTFGIEPGTKIERDRRLWRQLFAVLEGEIEVYIQPEPWRVRAGFGIWVPDGTKPWIEGRQAGTGVFLTFRQARRESYRLVELTPFWRDAWQRLGPGPVYSEDGLRLSLMRICRDEPDTSWSLGLTPPAPVSWAGTRAAELLAARETPAEIARAMGMGVRALDP
ncbi:MAG: cupin domain-containing protein, partial [Fimbriimonadales bacterium]